MRWAEHIAHMGEMRNAHKILVGKKKLFGRPTRRWEDNIKMDLLGNRVGRRRLNASSSG